MPFHTRPRLSRRRRYSLPVQTDEHCWHIYHPDPDEPLYVAEFGDAAMLAVELAQLPVAHEAVVLLDARRRVVAVLLDPPAEVGVFVGFADLPGLEEFSHTLSIVYEDQVYAGPPNEEDRRGYQALRRAHMAQGLLLLDVLLTDGDTVRSLAIGCDPDPVWFEEFDPLIGDDPAA